LRYTSFVIRLWLPGDKPDPDQVGCRGQIEHIQSGTSIRVHSLEEIQRFMQRWLGSTAPAEDQQDSPSNLEG